MLLFLAIDKAFKIIILSVKVREELLFLLIQSYNLFSTMQVA